jgi:hypothetical protein
MAYAKITMSNGSEIKTAPVGFSWTTFFWGGIPALFRQDWVWGVAILVAGALTSGLAGCIVAFFYNKMYIKGLYEKGYHVVNYPANVNDEILRAYLGFTKLPAETTAGA